MAVWYRVLAILILAAIPTGAWSQCPPGIEVPKSAVKTVSDIFRIRAQHPGEQVNFNDIEIANADFSGRNVSALCFNEAHLDHSDWSGATGRGVQFYDTDLSGSRWNRFRGEGLGFYWSILDNASLAYAVMPSTTFDNSKLSGINASHANLVGGQLHGNQLGSLQGARFDFSDMSRFEFRCGIGTDDDCGSMEGVSLVGANLTGAAIFVDHLSDWDMSNAILDHTRVYLPQLKYLQPSRVEGPVIVEPAEWSPDIATVSPRKAPVALSLSDLRAIWRAFDRSNKPGFDCRKSLSFAEQFICRARYFDGQSEFADQDRELNQAYSLARKKKRSIIRDQRQWLRERDACMALATDEYGWPRSHCIATAYDKRIEELWQIAGMDAGMAIGERRYYVDQYIGEFLSEIHNSALRSKLMPIALSNNSQLVVVDRTMDGRLRAQGRTIGSNYHLGGLSSPDGGMIFDPATGYYGGEIRDLGSGPCMPGYNICPIVRFRGYFLDVGPESDRDPEADKLYLNDYIMTGARAGFGRLVLVHTEQI